MNTETMTPVSGKQLAKDFSSQLQGKVDNELIEKTSAKLAAGAGDTSYGANGSIASMVIYLKCQCTIKQSGGKTFDGSAWGFSFPGGGALIGDVYTDDLNALYANTRHFTLTATPVYTAFYFLDKDKNLLGHFQAGSVSTVSGAAAGDGKWS